jgi:hypothetical protein
MSSPVAGAVAPLMVRFGVGGPAIAVTPVEHDVDIGRLDELLREELVETDVVPRHDDEVAATHARTPAGEEPGPGSARRSRFNSRRHLLDRNRIDPAIRHHAPLVSDVQRECPR